jgi:hypothetical protein
VAAIQDRFPEAKVISEERHPEPSALGAPKAAESRDTLRAHGYNVLEIDDPDEQKAGILRRYHVTEPDGMPIAIIEVRRCRKERHV